jgi:glutamine synthetase
MALLRSVAEKAEAALVAVEELSEAREKADAVADVEEKAEAYCDEVKPYFDKVRAQVDGLELLMPSDAWPLPKYREMLFLM